MNVIRVSMDELLGQWWDTRIESRDEVNILDWDELLNVIGIEIDDYQGKVPIITDFDKIEGTIHISFSLEYNQNDGMLSIDLEELGQDRAADKDGWTDR